MQFFLGIEGIGTRHSVAVLSDSKGTILSAKRLNVALSLHTTTGRELRTRLRRLIQEVLRHEELLLDDLRETTLCIGLSGVTFTYNASIDVPKVFEEMELSPGKLICTPDTHIIFASHTQKDRGGTITCSMGSMTYVMTPGGEFRVGGWGPTLGDEGSGYWLGRTTLRAIGAEADRNLPPSLLWEEIEEFLNDTDKSLPEWREHSILWQRRCHLLKEDTDLRTVVFSFAHDLTLKSAAEWRSLASSLAIPLISAWRKGEATATQIVREGAEHLASQFELACTKAKVALDHGPLVLYGGVFVHHPDFRDLVQEILEQRLGRSLETLFQGSPGAMRPACGALLLALGGSETGRLRLPSPEIIQNVFAEQESPPWTGVLAND